VRSAREIVRLGTHGFFVGFAWNELPKDSLVVDVGGGIGSAALAVLRAHPHLRFVVQDLPGPIADGRKVRVASDLPTLTAMQTADRCL
jgi:hypothetical protein